MMLSNSLKAAVLAISIIVPGASAHAALNRVWVASNGTDAATCGPSFRPCRTLQFAHNLLAPGGEIDILNSGNFGAVAITKSVSIINKSADGTVVLQPATGASAISVNVDTSTGSVFLQGLDLNGGGVVTRGIDITAAANVVISNCVFRRFAGAGVYAVYAKNLLVEDTTSNDNGAEGFMIASRFGGRATFNRVTASGNVANGLSLNANPSFVSTLVTVKDSLFTNNQRYGIAAIGGSNSATVMSVLDSKITGNTAAGVFSSVGGAIFLGRSQVSGNDWAYTMGTAGIIRSQNDNMITGNIVSDGDALQTYMTR